MGKISIGGKVGSLEDMIVGVFVGEAVNNLVGIMVGEVVTSSVISISKTGASVGCNKIVGFIDDSLTNGIIVGPNV